MIVLAWWKRPYPGEGANSEGVMDFPATRECVAGIAVQVGWFTVAANQDPGSSDAWVVYCSF